MTAGLRRRVVGLFGAFLGVALVAACTSAPDAAPVPLDATGPFVCDGVPSTGVELILGGPVERESSSGRWADPRFGCIVHPTDGRASSVTVSYRDVSEGAEWGDTDEAVLRTLSAQGGATAFEADVPGAGYRYGDTAGWVCSGRFLLVSALGETPPGRDWEQDVERLAVSLLPWACAGAEAPARTL